MNTKRILAALAAFSACGLAHAQAQTLSTVITVDRIVDPEVKASSRPAWQAAPLQMAPLASDLYPAEYLGNGTIVNCLSPLSPALWGETIAHTPYRGYASIGYLPAFNLGASAGYRFVDAQKAQAGAWLQYNGYQYTRLYAPKIESATGRRPFESDVKMRNHFATIGAYASYAPNQSSLLSASGAYEYASVLRPSWTGSDGYSQGSSRVDADVKWRSALDGWSYAASLDITNFGFGKPGIDMRDHTGMALIPLKQTYALIAANAGLMRDGACSQWLGIDAEAEFLNTNQGLGTLAEYRLNPFVTLGNRTFGARLGFVTSIGAGYIGKDTKFVPDIRLRWTPSSLPMSAFASFTGGKRLQQTASIFAADPYCNIVESFAGINANTVEGGISVGPIANFCLQAYARYAYTNGAIMPMFIADGIALPLWASASGGTLYAMGSMHSATVGAKASYAYRSLFSVAVGYEHGFSDLDGYSWWQWMDRAKSVASAGIEAYPMPRLAVGLGFELRSGRHGIVFASNQEVDLGDATNLSLHADYEVTPSISLSANIDNILNNKSLLISGLPAQGICGLVGVAYKF